LSPCLTCLAMTVPHRWDVIASFALLFPLSPRVSLLLAGSLITMTKVPERHCISIDRGVI
jgi:hypothetical protein